MRENKVFMFFIKNICPILALGAIVAAVLVNFLCSVSTNYFYIVISVLFFSFIMATRRQLLADTLLNTKGIKGYQDGKLVFDTKWEDLACVFYIATAEKDGTVKGIVYFSTIPVTFKGNTPFEDFLTQLVSKGPPTFWATAQSEEVIKKVEANVPHSKIINAKAAYKQLPG